MLRIGRPMSLSNRRYAAPPPAPTAGQTPLWRSLTTVVPAATITTANYATTTNFTDYHGEDSYARVPGARYGPAENPSWGASGLRHAIPYLGDTTNPDLVVFARKDMSAQTAYKNCGMHCGWFNFMSVGSGNKVIGNWDGGTGNLLGLGVIANGASKIGIIKHDGFIGQITYNLDDVELSQWVYLCYAWKYTAPNFYWRAWYKTLGGAMTELGSEITWVYDGRIFPNPVLQAARNGSGYPDLSGLGPWSGSVSGQSAYSLDAIATAALYPADIIEPGNGAFTWEVSADAVGGGDGRTLATAWTYDELQTEIRRGTILGNSEGLRKSGVVIPVPTTFAAALDFREDCQAGLVSAAGHTIRFTGTFSPDVELSVANFAPGVRLTGTGTISTRRTLPGPFTRPDPFGAPLVWLAEGDYLKSVSGFDDVGPTIEVDGYQFEPVAGANLAAVIDDLGTPEIPYPTPYKCYCDADGIYFSSASDPNTDGLERVYFAVLDQGLGGYLAVVEMSAGMIDSTLTIETGLIYRYVAGTTCPQYGLMVVNGAKTLASVSCLIIGGSYHALGWIGQSMAGTLCLNGARFSKFCPGHGAVGTTIAMYDPTTTGVGTIFFVLTPDCEELDSIFEGEQVSSAVRDFGSIYTHSGGGATNKHWGVYLDGTWKGGIATILCRDGERVVAETCTAFYIVGD